MRKYQVDVEGCGSEATEADARRVVSLLNDWGYDCEFVGCADNRYCECLVPDSVFQKALDVVAEAE